MYKTYAQLGNVDEKQLRDPRLNQQPGLFNHDKTTEHFETKTPKRMMQQQNNNKQQSQHSVSGNGVTQGNNTKVIAIKDKDHRFKIVKTNKIVVVKVWANWCVPCIQTKPQYEALANKYSKPGHVAFTTELLKLGLSKVGAVPTYLFFNNGEFVHTLTGGTLEELEDVLQNLLSA